MDKLLILIRTATYFTIFHFLLFTPCLAQAQQLTTHYHFDDAGISVDVPNDSKSIDDNYLVNDSGEPLFKSFIVGGKRSDGLITHDIVSPVGNTGSFIIIIQEITIPCNEWIEKQAEGYKSSSTPYTLSTFLSEPAIDAHGLYDDNHMPTESYAKSFCHGRFGVSAFLNSTNITRQLVDSYSAMLSTMNGY